MAAGVPAALPRISSLADLCFLCKQFPQRVSPCPESFSGAQYPCRAAHICLYFQLASDGVCAHVAYTYTDIRVSHIGRTYK